MIKLKYYTLKGEKMETYFFSETNEGKPIFIFLRIKQNILTLTNGPYIFRSN